MQKKSLKKIDYEKLFEEQKYYIQSLESMFNQACVEIQSQKILFQKTDEKINLLNQNIDQILELIANQEEKNPISLQEYLKSFCIKVSKNLIFGINIPAKFIKNSSIPTIQYHLYQNNCFLQKKISLYGLISKNKRDLTTIGQTFLKYLELCFKKKNVKDVKGILCIVQTKDEIYVDYYGNYDIEQEAQDFIKLYMQEESLENLFLQ